MSAPTVVRTEAPAELSNPGLVVFFGQSPNGWKMTWALEALKQAGAIPDYTILEVNLTGGEQFQPWFEAINPNCKMPALVWNRPDKPQFKVFESGSILYFLARTFDKEFKFHFDDVELEQAMLDWIFWSQANLGPNQGNANFWYRYTAHLVEVAKQRYLTETERLYKVLDDHLEGKEYMVGGKFTYADMIRCHFWCGISLSPYPSLKAWHDRIERLPIVLDALKVPAQDLVTRIKADPDLERQIMERMRKAREEKEQAEPDRATGDKE
ncbi:hypothetical protein Rhopal_003102-T1 [Rhodotorula paludigena]|uniref:Glutathione S-transferase n=1 Tax=Rhodotorula paludigena TaxID=86838 RepID=A0AAV5GIU5_9BASI|nr:hypothetical protein Rhopal_003102-T1 [Rhodotorula paludigena]